MWIFDNDVCCVEKKLQAKILRLEEDLKVRLGLLKTTSKNEIHQCTWTHASYSRLVSDLSLFSQYVIFSWPIAIDYSIHSSITLILH